MAEKVILTVKHSGISYFYYGGREAKIALVFFVFMWGIICFFVGGVFLLLFSILSGGIQDLGLSEIRGLLTFASIFGIVGGPLFILKANRSVDFGEEWLTIRYRIRRGCIDKNISRHEVSKIEITRFSNDRADVEIFTTDEETNSLSMAFFIGEVSSRQNIDNAIKELAKIYPVEVTAAYKESEES